MADLALLSEFDLRTRLNKDRWARTDNPNYKAEYEASDKPWCVIQRLWTSYTGHPDDPAWLKRKDGLPRFGWHAIARCYDPRIEQWVYRRLRRAEREWVFLKPPPAHFSTLAAAKDAGFVVFRWERDDD